MWWNKLRVNSSYSFFVRLLCVARLVCRNYVVVVVVVCYPLVPLDISLELQTCANNREVSKQTKNRKNERKKERMNKRRKEGGKEGRS